MKELKIRVPDTLLRRLPKKQEEMKEVVRLGLQRFAARRRKKARSVVDDTFAALAIRNHTRIEQLIEQTKYGE
ncbi:MAG: hypothetical protein A3F90_09090 [Deltaproteobacteria bacterium RIFCSPLOWO2_12_FULL_60_19]|nr:MAG: hypothetical protein A3F90_09090 [Deltaproteobacteria bacterium RIFCSPLOWO2_12_FULL_60_19]